MTKRLAAIGIKRKGESGFTIETDDLKVTTKTLGIIHNGRIKRCSVCAEVIPKGQCACVNCGSSNS